MAPVRSQWAVVGVVALVTLLTVHTLVFQMPSFESSESKLHSRQHRWKQASLDAPKSVIERGGVLAVQAAARLRKRTEEMQKYDGNGDDDDADADSDNPDDGIQESIDNKDDNKDEINDQAEDENQEDEAASEEKEDDKGETEGEGKFNIGNRGGNYPVEGDGDDTPSKDDEGNKNPDEVHASEENKPDEDGQSDGKKEKNSDDGENLEGKTEGEETPEVVDKAIKGPEEIEHTDGGQAHSHEEESNIEDESVKVEIQTTEEEKENEAKEKLREESEKLEPKETDSKDKTADGRTTKKEKEKKGKNKKMNILLLYPDDWRHDTIGGVAPIVQTPFLNELARDGIRFTHNCVTTSICWVSRATLFSGQYASRHKSHLLSVPVPFVQNFNKTWAGILRHKHNYHVGHMGKWQFWHEPGEAEALFSKAIFSGGAHWDVGSDDTPKHDSDVARDNALQFLEERPKDKPFALTVAFYPPKAIGESPKPGNQWFPKYDTMHLFVQDHIPPPRDDVDESWKRLPYFFQDEWVGRNRYMQRFNTTEKYQAAMKNYYRLVYTVDEACRTLVDKLKEQGEYENTLIIFTTDNGLFHGEHGLAGKWYPFEESIRVPLIIRDPRMPKEKRNTLDDSFTLNIDLAETILGAAGVKPDPGMQGQDMSDLYLKKPSSKEPWREEFYYEWLPPDQGVDFPSSTALVRKEFKYMRWPQFDYEQLFDMVNDPLEENDIAKNKTYAKILKEMRKRHDELQKKAI